MSDVFKSEFDDMAGLTYDPSLSTQDMTMAFQASQPMEPPLVSNLYEEDELDFLYDVFFESTKKQTF